MRYLSLLLLLAGCDSLMPLPTSHGDGASGATRGGAPARPAVNEVVSLQVGGQVTLVTDGGAPAGRLLLALTDGPCFQPGTHYLALSSAEPGTPYQLSAFPPRGSHLEVCAALVEGASRRTRHFARFERGPIVASATTRIEGVDLRLDRAPVEVTIPEGLRLP